MNVIDAQNVSYTINKKLGEGSQGTIFLLQDQKYIVKLYNNDADATATKSKINFLIHLDLDKNKFAIPLKHIIHPRQGYIASFASGMKPLSALKPDSSIQDRAAWYKATGGLLERYQLLAELAALLTMIHSKGLAYCDLSPKNVFVSETPKKGAVFLIDLDNLRYHVKNIANNIFTPFYGAPEVVTGNAANTTWSDCFSFAVLAYELFTFNHPLLGDEVCSSEPELEEKALAGNVPWVEDSRDTSNKCSTGLPSNMVMPQKLFALFRKTFEAGLKTPTERPTMGDWLETLKGTVNELLRCGNPDCGAVYPYYNKPYCPFCGFTPKRVFRIKIRRWEPVDFYDSTTNQLKHEFRLAPAVFEEMLADENTGKIIKASHLLLPGIDPRTQVITIKYVREEKNGVLAETMKFITADGFEAKTSPIMGLIPNGASATLKKEHPILLGDHKQSARLQFMIHFKDLQHPQRVITIE